MKGNNKLCQHQFQSIQFSKDIGPNSIGTFVFVNRLINPASGMALTTSSSQIDGTGFTAFMVVGVAFR